MQDEKSKWVGKQNNNANNAIKAFKSARSESNQERRKKGQNKTPGVHLE